MSDPDVLHDLELLPGRFIGQGKPAFIIAEIGQNHNGKRNTWKQYHRIISVEY